MLREGDWAKWPSKVTQLATERQGLYFRFGDAPQDGFPSGRQVSLYRFPN